MHSLIHLPPGKTLDDSKVGGDEFGWLPFVAASADAKRRYLAQVLIHNLADLSLEIRDAVVRQWVGEYELSGYIDHQSDMTLPADWNGKGVDVGFFADLKQFFARDDIAILGGNDNADEDHPLNHPAVAATGGRLFNFDLPSDAGSGEQQGLVARKDGDVWTTFCRSNGTKTRMSFETLHAPVSAKPKTPELVDVKITDFCTYGCEYCYQGSTPSGAHADMSFLNNLAHALGQARVFEVAIGGGEPTMHPKFIEIIEAFRKEGVVPNFTTRNLAWMRDGASRARILNAIGAFAFSVDTFENVKKLYGAMSEHDVPTNKACVQYVVGAGQDFDLEEIIDICRSLGLRLTLLGWKSVGRGKKMKPRLSSAKAYGIFKKAKRANRLPSLSIDTVLAAEWGGRLVEDGISPKLFAVNEGEHSMYVDAVAMSASASSYHEGASHDLGMSRNYISEKKIADVFAAIKPIRGDEA